MDYVVRWFTAFVLTASVELPIASRVLRGQNPAPLWRRLALVFFAQCASHPAVWFVFPELGFSYWAMIAIAETWALVSETLIYASVGQNISWRRALAASAIANSASYGLGVFLQSTFGWPR